MPLIEQQQRYTDPERLGLSTSEGKITIAAVIVGLVLEMAVVPVLQALKDVHPDAVWIPLILGIVGALLQVASVLGYQRARTQLKLGLISKDAGFSVSMSSPSVKGAADPQALRETLEGQLRSTLESPQK